VIPPYLLRKGALLPLYGLYYTTGWLRNYRSLLVC
jgi:hypothetical protein